MREKIAQLGPQRRLKNACVKFLIFFGLALASVFIPVAHFVLVPLFLLLSVVMAYLEYRKRFVVAGGSSDCFKCHGQVPVAGVYSETSIRLHCSACGAQNSLDLNSWEEERV